MSVYSYALLESANHVLELVLAERQAQQDKWGEQNHPDGTQNAFAYLADNAKEVTDREAQRGTLTWAQILLEEFWEAMSETDPEKLQVELVQVAAVAVAWVEAIRRRTND